MNPRTILGVSSSATKDDIKKAFRKLAHIHHPDKGGDAKKFSEINGAYQMLMKEGEPRSGGNSGFKHTGFWTDEADIDFDFSKFYNNNPFRNSQSQEQAKEKHFHDIFREYKENLAKEYIKKQQQRQNAKDTATDAMTKAQIRMLINKLKNVDKKLIDGKWYYAFF